MNPWAAALLVVTGLFIGYVIYKNDKQIENYNDLRAKILVDLQKLSNQNDRKFLFTFFNGSTATRESFEYFQTNSISLLKGIVESDEAKAILDRISKY